MLGVTFAPGDAPEVRWFSLPGDATGMESSENLINWTTRRTAAQFSDTVDPGVFEFRDVFAPPRRYCRLRKPFP
ncbi:MAG: hypothetical protein KA004_10795 [Verrucomicrobiales bacterium]|nr:hypothetical protein [Verrucomicrobiales bacterium]